MSQLSTDIGQILRDFPAHTVHIADAIHLDAEGNPVDWGDPVAHLYCEELKICTKDKGYDEAILTREIGEGLYRPGDATVGFTDVQPIDFTGKYVLVTIPLPELDTVPPATRTFIGYVLSKGQVRSGVKPGGEPAAPDPDQNKLTGRQQVFTAVGLEYFLDRTQIDDAVIHRDWDEEEEWDESNPNDQVRIQRPMVFNDESEVDFNHANPARGNRHPDPQRDADGNEPDEADAVYAFADGSQTPVPFSIRDLARHLLRYHPPQDKDGNLRPLPYKLWADTEPIADALLPVCRSERRTVFQVLNEVINPRRGLVWWLEVYNEGADGLVARIRVASRAVTNIDLGNGKTLPANANQHSVDFDEQLDADDLELEDDRSRHYHQIVTRGARMTCTFSVGFGDWTLLGDWDADAMEAYKAAVSDDDAEANDQFRRDERFYRVFMAYRIPEDWDGLVTDAGISGDEITPVPAIPLAFSSGGAVLAGQPLNVNGLRLLNKTRLRRGVDYTHALHEPIDVPQGREDLLPPFAIIDTNTEEGEDANFQYLDKLSQHDLYTSYFLSMQQTTPGFLLRSGAGLQHAIVTPGDWDGANPSELEPELSPIDQKLTATVCAEADSWCEARYPADNMLPADKPIERLTIYTGGRYRLDYLAPHTVVGLAAADADAPGVPIFAQGGLLRDDRAELAAIARVAYEWYRTERQPVTMPFKNCRDVFELGMLITQLGSGSTAVPINTVVSRITFDLARGRMTVETDGEDLEAQLLV